MKLHNLKTLVHLKKILSLIIKAHKLLYDTYDTEQEIYLQSKIDENKMAVSNKKSAMAWKAVNDVSGRKKSNNDKIKAISGEDRIIVWHNHFKYLLGIHLK